MDRRSFLALSGASAATLLGSGSRVRANTALDDSPMIGVQRGDKRSATQLRVRMTPHQIGVSIIKPRGFFQVASTAMAEDMLLANIEIDESRQPVELASYTDAMMLGCVINQGGNKIAMRTRRGAATYLLMNKEVCSRIVQLYWPTYANLQKYNPQAPNRIPIWGPSDRFSKGRWEAAAMCAAGSGKAVYCSDCMPPDQIVVGYKGQEFDAAGMVSESEPGRFYPVMRDTDFLGSFEDYFYKFRVRI